ncbi:MAG: hypothetical protein KAT58_07210, partial [candidate division Zixibacteria bacterium]|nr:hypothetical protein [candidate division Zixibacteria bacterium]
GWWKLDEGSGTTAADSSGNGNNLTLNGDPQWVTGLIGGALEFDGNDDVEVATVSRSLKPASLTVTAWVKADPATSDWSWVAGQGDNYGLIVHRDHDNDVHFYFHKDTGWSGVGSGDVGILDGKWHHIAGVFDEEDGSLYVYKDGALADAQSAAGPIDYSVGEGFTIGSMQGQRNFLGAIDDVRVYNHALSQAEMNTIALVSSSPENTKAAPVEKKYIIHPVAHAHIDMNWLWPWEDTVDTFRINWESMLKRMDKHPWFVFLQSQPVMYEAIAQAHPELFERIRPRIASGNWDVIGGFWDESNTNCPRGEALARSLMLGKHYFQENLGVTPKMGWLPDSFGMSWQMPQILKLAETDYHFFVRCKRNTPLYWWEGPDGSRILTLNYGGYGYNGTVKRDDLEKKITGLEKAGGGKRMLLVYGRGDHGGWPTEGELRLIEHLNEDPSFPARFEFTTIEKYFELVKEELSDIPVLKDEMNFTFEGAYTTHADMKQINRQSENMLLTAEAFCSIANMFMDMKVPYPAQELESAWKHTCFNQFHDIIAGVSTNSTYPEVRAKFAVIKGIAEGQRDQAIQVIARGINTKDLKGISVVVFNPLGWRRSDVVKVWLPAYQLPKGKLAVKDPQGELHPVQLIDRGGQGRNAVLLFAAHNVPSMGYKTYSLQAVEQTFQGPRASRDGSMENQFFRSKLDMKTGNLASLKLKQGDIELIPKGKQANVLLLQNEDPKEGFMSSWNIRPIGKPWHLDKADNVVLVEEGPVRCVYRITHKYNASTFTRDLVIYADLPRLDVEMTADWHEADLWVRALFPTAVENGTATFHVPYAAKRRPADGHEVPAITWFDLSNENAGLSLLNNAKYGCSVDGSKLTISLLRNPVSPKCPDPNPDEGWHQFTYSLYPHPGDWKAARSMRQGAGLNQTLLGYVKHKQDRSGILPLAFSFVGLEPENLIITA